MNITIEHSIGEWLYVVNHHTSSIHHGEITGINITGCSDDNDKGVEYTFMGKDIFGTMTVAELYRTLDEAKEAAIRHIQDQAAFRITKINSIKN